MTTVRGSRVRGAEVQVLRDSMRARTVQLMRLVIWSVVEAVPTYFSGHLVAHAVDRGFLIHRPATGLAWLAVLGLAVFVGGWGTRQLYPNLASLVEPFRDSLVAITVRSALRRSTAPGHPVDRAAVARLTRQVEIAREAYASLLVVVQGFVVTTVSAILGLAGLAPAALLFVLPPLAAGLGLFVWSLGVLARRQHDSIVADERISEISTELVEARRDIVACGGEDIAATTADRHIEAQALATRRLARLSALRNLSASIGGLLPVVLVLVGGPWLVHHGATTGTVLGVLTYVLGGIHPAMQTLVRGLGSNGVWLVVTLRRLLEGTDETDRFPVTSKVRITGPARAGRGEDLRLSGVTFSYGCAPEPVIRDFDLIIPYGDHMAVVGPSGVGKSTLAGILSGLLDPDRGTVALGDMPLQECSAATLARSRVLVPEEAYVFSGSLRANLTYLRRDASRRDVDRAVNLLGARNLVDRLGGYRAHIESASLSAGERQLIALVRAYLSPGRIVILDEATCQLDPQSEARVERAFARRPGTLIVIAHRISSALRAKRILVMDSDRLQLGTHEELLVASELYRDLVGHWAGGTVGIGEGPRTNGRAHHNGNGSARTNGSNGGAKTRAHIPA